MDVKQYGQGVPSDVLFRVVGSLMSHYLSLCTGLFCCVCILQIQIIIVVDDVAVVVIVVGDVVVVVVVVIVVVVAVVAFVLLFSL